MCRDIKFTIIVFFYFFIFLSLFSEVAIYSGAKIEFNGNASADVSGNWTNNGGDLNFNGCTIAFIGETDSYVSRNGGEFFDYLKIDKADANVILNNDLTINNNLNFVSGNLITTSSNAVFFGSDGTISGETATKYLIGALNLVRPVGNGSSDFGGVGVSINSGADNLGNVTVVRKSGPSSNSVINGVESIDRKWNITSSITPSNGRDLTLSWVAPDDNSSNLNFSKTWQSDNGSSNWQAFGGVVNTSGSRSITVPVTELNYFTVSSTSTINLPESFAFDEGNSLTVNFEDYISNFDSKKKIMKQKLSKKSILTSYKKRKITKRKSSHKIIKNSQGKIKAIVMNIPNEIDPLRSTSVSITGLDSIEANVTGMNVEFTAEEDWNGVDDIIVSVVENSKKNNRNTKLSYYDDTRIIVNPINDAPYIISQFPIVNFTTRQDSLTNMSIKVDDIDNSFVELSFIWKVDNVDQVNNDSLFAYTFESMGTYDVKAFVYDGALLDSTSWSVLVVEPSGIDDENYNNLPKFTKIFQNYPNPFNPTTKINYQLHENSSVELLIYNQVGQLIRRLLNKGNVEPGRYSVSWDGKDDFGAMVSAGLYFYSIKTDSYQNIKKAVMVK